MLHSFPIHSPPNPSLCFSNCVCVRVCASSTKSKRWLWEEAVQLFYYFASWCFTLRWHVLPPSLLEVLAVGPLTPLAGPKESALGPVTQLVSIFQFLYLFHQYKNWVYIVSMYTLLIEKVLYYQHDLYNYIKSLIHPNLTGWALWTPYYLSHNSSR